MEPEDIAEQVATSLTGIYYLTELFLEPLRAPESAKKEILTVPRAITKSRYGVLFKTLAIEPSETWVVIRAI